MSGEARRHRSTANHRGTEAQRQTAEKDHYKCFSRWLFSVPLCLCGLQFAGGRPRPGARVWPGYSGATTRIAPGTTVAVNGVCPSGSPSSWTGSGVAVRTLISRPRA